LVGEIFANIPKKIYRSSPWLMLIFQENFLGMVKKNNRKTRFMIKSPVQYTPPLPKGCAPAGGSITGRIPENVPAPPCLGEALRRGAFILRLTIVLMRGLATDADNSTVRKRNSVISPANAGKFDESFHSSSIFNASSWYASIT
jgi:hypothetical protein